MMGDSRAQARTGNAENVRFQRDALLAIHEELEELAAVLGVVTELAAPLADIATALESLTAAVDALDGRRPRRRWWWGR